VITECPKRISMISQGHKLWQIERSLKNFERGMRQIVYTTGVHFHTL